MISSVIACSLLSLVSDALQKAAALGHLLFNVGWRLLQSLPGLSKGALQVFCRLAVIGLQPWLQPCWQVACSERVGIGNHEKYSPSSFPKNCCAHKKSIPAFFAACSSSERSPTIRASAGAICSVSMMRKSMPGPGLRSGLSCRYSARGALGCVKHITTEQAPMAEPTAESS